jgi:NADPH-dependent curcumin reductase CurA
MTSNNNVKVLLSNRPRGWPQESDFQIVEEAVKPPGSGEVLLRHRWLSLDPYMRGRMNEGPSYVPPVEIGAVMCGECVAEVLQSNNERFKPGDSVYGDLGWQLYSLHNGKGLRKLDPRLPATANLNVLGMPGLTAWCGLTLLGQPRPGETVLVSGAMGAVGSLVGQIAKLKACRAVGIAGGPEKCRMVVEELGFDACIDYKAADYKAALKTATPDGVDVYFDNVGGEILDSALTRMNTFGRVAVCGLISQYNATEAYGMKNFRLVLVKRLKVQGFIIFDLQEHYTQAYRELGEWVASGKLRYKETIAEGIRSAPAAFIGLLRGANVGKQLVRLAGS